MRKWVTLILLASFLLPLTAFSQSGNQSSNKPQRKIALVIGNSNYLSSSLANPLNDARAMRDALQSVGFTVMEFENLSQSQMKKAIDDFGLRLKSNEVGLFYYAGHGIQSKGYNYLIPVDADLQSEQQVEYDCVQADRVLGLMEASGTKVNIIILDACRNNPFERSWTRSSGGRGLAFMSAPSGTLIAYATSPGNTASDGSGKNGLYTSAILESIRIPDITILQMFQNVRSIVSEKSKKQQIPWESTSMTGDFYFGRTNQEFTQPDIIQGNTTAKSVEEENIKNETAESNKNNSLSIPNNNDNFHWEIEVSYDLIGRDAILLPKPEIKNLKEGIFIIPISVNQDGVVMNFDNKVVISGKTQYIIKTNEKTILMEVNELSSLLVQTAMSAKFSPKTIAQKVQYGTITYTIKQK
jgi:hypothetical protein